MKQYESYRDSGIEWLGMIPSHWKVCKVKNLCTDIFAGGTPSTSVPSYWDGQIPWIPSGCCHDCNIDNAPKTITEEGLNNSSTRLIPANTTVMAMTGATCSFVGYLTFRSCANQSVVAFIPKLNKIDSRFLFYLLQGMRKYILTFQTGGAQGGINVNDCQNLIIPHIPFEEQQVIASYLDIMVGQTNSIIAEKEAMVEDLQSYRKSIISEAVTQGLNPNAPMKDSGVQWIGMIPSNWEMIKLKSIAKVNGRIGFRGYTTEDLVPAGMGAYTIGGKHITNCVLDLSHPDFISWDKYYESPEIMVKKGDILMAQRGSLGKAALVREDIGNATINPSLVLLNNIKINNVFLYYYLISSSTLAYIDLLNTATAVPMISQNQIENIKLLLPSDEEQNQISNYLDERTSGIDTSISELQSQIEDLKSYKSSMIFEAVTGKFDLR